MAGLLNRSRRHSRAGSNPASSAPDRKEQNVPRTAEQIFEDIYERTEEETKPLIAELTLLDKSETPNLDELQKEVEKLLTLLKDRQPGLVSWHTFLQQRIDDISEWRSKQ